MTTAHPETSPTIARPRFRLLVYRDASVRTILLDRPRLVVGRAADCEISLADPTASRHHLVLEVEHESVRFRDLGGTNITLLNGRPCNDGLLPIGATLLVGMTKLTLDEVRPQAPVRVVPDARTTAVLFRRYLEDDLEADALAEANARTGGDVVTAARPAAIVARLRDALTDVETVEDAAYHLLDATLEICGADAGVLADLESETVQVLASLHRGPAGTEIHMPQEALHEIRTRGRAFSMVPPPERSNEPSRAFIPLTGSDDGVLALESAAEASLDLRLADALGGLVWKELLSVRERFRLRQEVSRLRFQGSPANRVVLSSARLQELRRELTDLAIVQDVAVLLLGEEGTEKEDLARYFHAQSTVASGPFQAFYTSVLPEHRLEQALLGTGIGPDGVLQGVTAGVLLRAHQGTLYVEEPQRLPDHLQDRLARILTDGALQPTDHDTQVPVHVRLVAGMTVDPGTDPPSLRPALAELLAGARLQVPPLREHPDDIASLAELLLAEMGPTVDGAPRTLNEQAKQRLLRFGWPGNVRQLRRVLETAAARAGRDPIASRHLPEEVRASEGSGIELPTLAALEKEHIVRVLGAVGGSKRAAAQTLGIASSTLYEKLRRYGIRR